MRIYNILPKTQECPSVRFLYTFTEDSLFVFSSQHHGRMNTDQTSVPSELFCNNIML